MPHRPQPQSAADTEPAAGGPASGRTRGRPGPGAVQVGPAGPALDADLTAALKRKDRRLVRAALGVSASRAMAVRYAEGMLGDTQVDEVVVNGCDADLATAFRRLRWGGLMVMTVTGQRAALTAIKNIRRHGGFAMEAGPQSIRGRLGIGPRTHYVIGRKVRLIEPSERTDRFTFDVRLTREPTLSDQPVVVKTVPKYRRVVQRLSERFPDAPRDVILQRADKLVKRVFPVFLTRETAFLRLLQRDLPPHLKSRVPRALAVERAENKTVRRLYMNWLRLSGEMMSHLDFASQSAELLEAIHNQARVMHLDLRLDNVVISGGNVCFVDFGSAVRIGEDLERSPMLRSLFSEMMQTSQIQQTLGRMKDAGRLTSDVLRAAHGRVDPAVDLFYLALQLSRPYWNPDLMPFIGYDETSEQTREIKKLSDAILRPHAAAEQPYETASDVAASLRAIRRRLST